MNIMPISESQLSDWLALRCLLWPDHEDVHLQEMRQLITQAHCLQLLAYTDTQQAIAMLEASIRYEYVNGTQTSPVAFLEGIYVLPEYRRSGIATGLVQQVEIWAKQFACTEFASDAALDNQISHAMHQALGFHETERVVYFKKNIG
ncbi:AAC(6')-Ighjkrstuvwx family aminoglycoside N-acetyltransferase [Acinetobacter gyllenbergii]|uniref:Aminoglycoside N(6')-acetyltransferase type 1 n=1 Tax=Acinetobacter gyllenbergii TaxID=134534 RepID=A0A0U2YPK4_9GAMM|nr:AAC(6')-Ighjkrstuvwx family aminoglycoside N-acetyltransferase [Acinetobacter gyllenbergii]ALS88215.1 aminoglycoside 6'-N-acetyltransferase [Acinetobacter gyllenbergii]ALS88218.1 aminoglycoside 6'-N-acetyltransferase [Acinetobacter gyllenbergii]MCU4581302.1 AAC(6')-Ighjkrstuvwx family aminoglycoside N-acetyltransferase [Acinetobacter gyllenbergii]